LFGRWVLAWFFLTQAYQAALEWNNTALLLSMKAVPTPQSGWHPHFNEPQSAPGPFIKSVTSKLTYYHFWLDSPQDALYSAAGTPPRRNPSGASGRDVGDELDLTITWQIDPHSSVLFGASHFWPGSFINTTGPSDDADLIYVQYTFKF